MAAFSSFHFRAPGILCRGASVASRRVTQRPATDLAEITVRVRVAAAEFVLLLWTVGVLAFAMLVMAGFAAPR